MANTMLIVAVGGAVPVASTADVPLQYSSGAQWVTLDTRTVSNTNTWYESGS